MSILTALLTREHHGATVSHATGMRLASHAMNRLMARIYDRMMRSTPGRRASPTRGASSLRDARGDVLEIGAGTGLNLVAYPREGITRLVLTEPNPAMRRHIDGKRGEAPVAPEVVEASGERLPFEDASFDTVVGTLVLCEPRDPDAVVAEVARVLKPGGRYLFPSTCAARTRGSPARRIAGLPSGGRSAVAATATAQR